MNLTRRHFLALSPAVAVPLRAEEPDAPVIKAGMIGLDTSHVVAFTDLFHGKIRAADGTRIQVVAACPGSTKVPENLQLAEKYSKELEAKGVKIVADSAAVIAQSDVLMLESVDGAPHLKEARPLLDSGKPLYVDKPAAGSLKDVVALHKLAAEKGVPMFSSSALRFAPDVVAMRDPHTIGKVLGAHVWGPFHRKAGVPPIYYYGIHGVESLFTIMGTGCEFVSCTMLEKSVVATGQWPDGRLGTFRGIGEGRQEFGAVVFGEKAIQKGGSFAGYDGLVAEIATFFTTRKPPVAAQETAEIFAFMDAAALSAERGGASVSLKEMMDLASS